MAKKIGLSEEALEFFRQQGARGGKIGGKRSLETMTREQRSERARKASKKAAEVRAQRAAAVKKKTPGKGLGKKEVVKKKRL
jgi:hypothetical protein